MNLEVEEFYMDVEGYAKNYGGRIQILKLLHIADQCAHNLYFNNAMELDALKLAYDLMRHGRVDCDYDLHLFEIIAKQINGRLGKAYHLDEFWCYKKKHGFDFLYHFYRVQLEKTTDEMEKDQYAFCLDKLHYNSGKMATVFRPFSRRLRLIQACMYTLLVAMETRQYAELRHRTLLQIAYYHQSNDIKFKLDTAWALADLGEGKYYEAAKGFIELVKDLKGFSYNEMISSEDIVVYGLVCAVATFQRSKLQNALDEIIDPNGGVRQHLTEIIKPFGAANYLTDIMKHFLAGRFTDGIRVLEKQRPRFLLDLYLCEHVENLFSKIKDLISGSHPSHS